MSDTYTSADHAAATAQYANKASDQQHRNQDTSGGNLVGEDPTAQLRIENPPQSSADGSAPQTANRGPQGQ